MTNSQIFTAAHQITKKIILEGDSYSATFSLCLKMIKNGEIAHEYYVSGAYNRDGSIDCKCSLSFVYGNGTLDYISLDAYNTRKTDFFCTDEDIDVCDEKATIYFENKFNSKNIYLDLD